MTYRYDLIIEKKAKYYQEFQQLEGDGITPIPYTTKTLKCTIKESYETTTTLHDLTEANGGVIRVDETTGTFAIQIDADQTNVTPDFAVYDIIAMTTTAPTTDIERLIEGKITYTEGVT